MTGHPQANGAVIAFLNELGWAMRDVRRLSREQSEALEALDELHRRAAAAELTRLTDEMGLYHTDQEAS